MDRLREGGAAREDGETRRRVETESTKRGETERRDGETGDGEKRRREETERRDWITAGGEG